MEQKPFKFCKSAELVLLSGKRASTLKELLDGLKTLPDSVVYYHTHRFLIQHEYISPEPPNDFAYWTTNVLLERILGEKLAAIDIINYPTISDLKNGIIRIIENNMETYGDRIAPEGMEFNFMRVKTVIIETGFEARNLKELYTAIKEVPIRSIYFHIAQARLLFSKRENDFSLWLREELHEDELANDISKLDPYTWTLERLRNRLVKMLEERLDEQN